MRRILEDGRPGALRLTLDGSTIEGELFMAEAMNVRFTGSPLPLRRTLTPVMNFWISSPSVRRRKLTFTWRGEPLRIEPSSSATT